MKPIQHTLALIVMMGGVFMSSAAAQSRPGTAAGVIDGSMTLTVVGSAMFMIDGEARLLIESEHPVTVIGFASVEREGDVLVVTGKGRVLVRRDSLVAMTSSGVTRFVVRGLGGGSFANAQVDVVINGTRSSGYFEGLRFTLSRRK